MTAPDLVSTCCGALARVAGRTTQYHCCTWCQGACDVGPAGEAEARARTDQKIPQPRSWRIELPAGEPILTANHRKHRYKANARTQDLVSLMIRLCKDVHRLPRLEAVTVDLEYACPPFRKAQRHPEASDRVEDHENLAPTRKALIDGIVRAGVLVSDNRKRVVGGQCRILPETHWMGRLTVVITEAAGGDAR